jgi:protein MpaA
MSNTVRHHAPTSALPVHPPVNLLGARFDALAARGLCCRAGTAGHFFVGNAICHLPRFLYRDPDHGRRVKIGIFTGLRGNLEGGLALLQFLQSLEEDSWRAAGYELWLYPLCNPTAHEDRAGTNRRGASLDSDFWKDSAEPEIMLLERELVEQRFDAVITLHTDGRFAQMTGSAIGGTIASRLLESGLALAGFVVDEQSLELPWPEGALSVLPGPRRVRPNLRFGVPRSIPMRTRITALDVAVGAVLASARHYLSPT